jgi:hypothetical protein
VGSTTVTYDWKKV